jgi:curli biogenesis system outer membrane secretion channel CsgG
VSTDKRETPKFTKRQIVKSGHFAPVERDVLQALMNEKENYTIDQAKKLVGDYAKRKVK